MNNQNLIYAVLRADNHALIAIFTSKQLAITSLELSYSACTNILWEHTEDISVCSYNEWDGNYVEHKYKIQTIQPYTNIQHL